MTDHRDGLAFANISRDEVALWIFAGMTGCVPPSHLTTEQAVADIEMDPRTADGWARCRRGADNVMARLMEKFAPGVPS